MIWGHQKVFLFLPLSKLVLHFLSFRHPVNSRPTLCLQSPGVPWEAPREEDDVGKSSVREKWAALGFPVSVPTFETRSQGEFPRKQFSGQPFPRGCLLVLALFSGEVPFLQLVFFIKFPFPTLENSSFGQMKEKLRFHFVQKGIGLVRKCSRLGPKGNWSGKVDSHPEIEASYVFPFFN